MRFKPYGPFALQDWSDHAVDELYASFRREHSALEKAIGVYIVATVKDGHSIPLYVGKTDKGFGGRIKAHFNKPELEEAFHEGGLSFFVLARMTPAGKFVKRSKKPETRKKSIDRLEFALIGTCMQLNDNLLNKKEMKFHEAFTVPGFINSKKEDWDSSAKKLAKLLGTKG